MGWAPIRNRGARTAIFIAIAVLANSFGNLLLAIAMERMPRFSQVDLSAYIWDLLSNSFMLPGAALNAVYSLIQLWLFSWADLSFVVPCIASSYIVSTLLAEFVLGEQVLRARWIGDLLICIGVILVAKTPVATRTHDRRPGE